MRVVQVSCVRDPMRRPGAELLRAWPTLGDVARAAASAGVEVAVVQAAWRDETVDHGGVPVHLVAEGGMPERYTAAVPRRLVRAVRALQPDVIHLQGLTFPLQTRMLCGTGIPVLAQDHGGTPATRPDVALLRRWGLRRLAGVAFTAREQAEPYVRAGVLRADMPVFEVLESSSRFTPGDRDAARAATGMAGAPAVLWVGRLTADKDPMTVLEGFALAAERLPDARLWMAYGGAALEAEVRTRIASDPRLRERVHLLGRVPHGQIEQVCRAADVFVSASRREAGGYAVLEALACGLPVLAADIPAARRILRGGAVGGLFPPGDARALAELLVQHAQRTGEAERKAVRDHFDHCLSFGVVGRELRAAYESVAP